MRLQTPPNVMMQKWYVIGLIVLGAIIVWQVLDRLFLSSALDSLLPAHAFERSV